MLNIISSLFKKKELNNNIPSVTEKAQVPFDINLAKKNHPVCLRNGTPCIIEEITDDDQVIVSFSEKDYPFSKNGKNFLFCYYDDGFFNELEESPFDLMMKS